MNGKGPPLPAWILKGTFFRKTASLYVCATCSGKNGFVSFSAFIIFFSINSVQLRTSWSDHECWCGYPFSRTDFILAMCSSAWSLLPALTLSGQMMETCIGFGHALPSRWSTFASPSVACLETVLTPIIGIAILPVGDDERISLGYFAFLIRGAKALSKRKDP